MVDSDRQNNTDMHTRYNNIKESGIGMLLCVRAKTANTQIRVLAKFKQARDRDLKQQIHFKGTCSVADMHICPPAKHSRAATDHIIIIIIPATSHQRLAYMI